MKEINLLYFMKFIFAKFGFSFTFIILLVSLTFSQGIAIGQWREHLPYNNVISIAVNKTDVYAATPHAVFKYNKDDFSISRITKINLLSDIGISRIAWHKPSSTLIIAYSNGNLDLLKNNKVRNYNDIVRASISGSKRINNIIFRENDMYLACDFGITVFDLTRREFRATYIIGTGGTNVPIYDIEFFNDTIYAASNSFIYKAYINTPNLSNFANWKIDTNLVRTGFVFNNLIEFNNTLVANITKNTWDTDTSYIYQNGVWNVFNSVGNSNKKNFKVYNNLLMIAQAGSILSFDTSFVQVSNLWNYGTGFPYPNDFVVDEFDNLVLWIGDEYNGLIRNFNFWTNNTIYPSGPYTNKVYNLKSTSNSIIGVPGARDNSWNNTFTLGGVFEFYAENWSNMSRSNNIQFDTIYDVLSIAANPNNNKHWYIATYGKGVVEIRDYSIVKTWDRTNTPLGGTTGLINNSRISDLKFDSQGNLWIATSFTNECITVKTHDQLWFTFPINFINSGEVVSQILIDKSNNKWLSLPKGGGILVFNENGTFANKADDRFRRLTNQVGQGNLPSMNVFSMAEDKDGRIWVGTDKGVVVFYSPENIFSGQNFDAHQIIISQGGYGQPLMVDETVNAIVVDGGNRKWIGTEKGGVFLLSPDGLKQIEHFNTSNSPILSNSISSIAIQPNTGEVFFGTYSGIISYKGTATEGKDEYDETKVYAYPNPVRPNYTGKIAIKNLVANSDIKITDISGNLVYQTKSFGGQAIWDGLDIGGNRPKTGVYLVFASNKDGTESMVTKILFVQ